MYCYLCDSNKITIKDGSVRDNNSLKILECTNCSLVFLNNFDHIQDEFYEQSKMRDGNQIKKWIKDTYKDDKRRFLKLKNSLINKDILDFGAGNGNFLKLSKKYANSVVAVELDKESHKIYKKNKIDYYSNINEISVNKKFDIITLFHVIEHFKDPITYLKNISNFLKKDGKIILEFPNSNDALLSLYKSKNFSEYTYWSCHLMLFNEKTIRTLIEKSGLICGNIEQIQRYPISNHLYWLSNGKPGGHEIWPFLNNNIVNKKYEKILSDLKICDTIMVEVKK